jgi:hypothetical protein
MGGGRRGEGKGGGGETIFPVFLLLFSYFLNSHRYKSLHKLQFEELVA